MKALVVCTGSSQLGHRLGNRNPLIKEIFEKEPPAVGEEVKNKLMDALYYSMDPVYTSLSYYPLGEAFTERVA